MNKRFLKLSVLFFFVLGFFMFAQTTHATTTSALVFSDNFDSLTNGNLNGQNGWVSAGGVWTVTATTSGKNIVSTLNNYTLLPITQTGQAIQDSRVKFDFYAYNSGGFEPTPHIWLRRTSTASTSPGYHIYRHQTEQRFYPSYFNGTGITLLGFADYTITPGTWYTMEFEVINDSSGNPVLKFWAYPQGDSRPVTPTIEYTDTNKYITGAGYSGIGGSITSATVDNFYLYSGEAELPSAPQNLDGTASTTQVTLTWNAPVSDGGAPVTDYLVEYRTGANSFATFSDGVSTATTTTVTVLTSATTYDFQVSAVNSVGTGTAATKQLTTYSNVTITTPSRSVTASSSVATIGIYRSECDITFYIPYIQTSNDLSVAATVNSGLPSGGGVRFVLTDGESNQTIVHDLSAPFTATFSDLDKGEYTLDAYIVDSSQVVQSGASNHDIATNIGIGDIYVAIGDSVTEGYDGTSYNVDPYNNWTEAAVTSDDYRNYPQCGISEGNYHDHWQNVSHHISLNNVLEDFYGYPVFILNEGVAAINTSGYNTRTGLTTWQDRMDALQPNKWLIHLGINDGNGSSGSQTNLQTLINTLVNTYSAVGSDIVLAVPSYRTGWAPYINNLVVGNDLTAGPDFKTFYDNNTSPVLYVGVHPNVAGHVEMGRLWGISIISPKNLQATQDNEDIDLSWDDLSTIESSIAGYRIYYGTDPDDLDTVVDVGDTTSTTIDSGLSDDTTYYFAVQGYDDDAFVVNNTATSSAVSLLYDIDNTPPTVSVTSPTNGVTVSGNVSVVASASDDNGVAGVQFLLDGSTNIGSEDTASPYSVTWSSSAVSDGSHTLSAVARDTSGNYTTSTSITVTVDNSVAEESTPTRTPATAGASSSRRASFSQSQNSSSNSTPTPAYTFVRDLTFNSQGQDVRNLQNFLMARGFLAAGNNTGFFGPLTQAALAAYQRSSGIVPAIGYFGPLTRASVNISTVLNPTGLTPSNSNSNQSQKPVSPAPSNSSAFNRDLELASKGSDVRALQQFLNRNGFSVAQSGPGSVGQETEIFGYATRAALIRFQNSRGITPAVGYFGPKTRQAVLGSQ